jgi:DHA2 family multidrug resistance protein
LYEPYNALVASYERTLIATGHAAQYAHDVAVGKVYQMFQAQVAILAYSDVFLFFGFAALCVVPLCFLASGGRAKAAPGAAH